MLKSETNTPQMAGRILDAAYVWAANTFAENPNGPLDVYFEHGQWWLFDIAGDRTFSVVDADGGDSVDGFAFEEV